MDRRQAPYYTIFPVPFTAPPDSLVSDAPAPDTTAGKAQAFPCSNCGADMTWDPGPDALSCSYCGHTEGVPRSDERIVERALSRVGEAARGLGLEMRVLRCETCGAQVAFDEKATAEACVYCGSSSVLPQDSNRNSLRPESLVPLDVGRKRVEDSFLRWIRGLWFRPNDLKKTKKFDAVGIYVPFWTFDVRVFSSWSADAGHYYYVPRTITVNGKRRTTMERRTRWEPAWGDRRDAYDDYLINASLGLPEKLLRKLGDFDTSELVPYRPEYLAGWRAEEYQVDLEQGWGRAREAILELQQRRCAGDVPGDTYRNLRVHNELDETYWKHILLPIWSLQYRYKSETYTVLVHGQTGKIVGKAPISWLKILLLFLGIAAAVVIGLAFAGIAGALGAAFS